MAIRNGRFKNARTIISGRANTWFRILNSGEFDNTNIDRNAITVNFGPGANDSAVVRATFSLDFFAQRDVLVSGTGVVEGIYESLPNPDFKSGRFKTRQPMDPTTGVLIVTPGNGTASAIYRVFNSGLTPLQLVSRNPGGGGTETPIGAAVAPEESLDFVTPNNRIVLIKGTSTTVHIEGIYDFLGRV